MILYSQNLSFTLLYIVTTSWHIRAHHKPAPRLQLTEIFHRPFRCTRIMLSGNESSTIQLVFASWSCSLSQSEYGTLSLTRRTYFLASSWYWSAELMNEKFIPPLSASLACATSVSSSETFFIAASTSNFSCEIRLLICFAEIMTARE